MRRLWVVVTIMLALVVGTAPTSAAPTDVRPELAERATRIPDAPQRYVDHVFPTADVTLDVEYGQSMNYYGALETHYADVYTPSGDTDVLRPLVIWMHPGAFASGNRGQMAGFATDSARRGFVSASISYRLRPTVDIYDWSDLGLILGTINDAGMDAQAAIRFFRAHAETYGIDPDRIVTGGYSAGAVNALWTNFHLEQALDEPWGDQSSHISAAISLAGAYGGVAQPGDAPIAMFHGSRDTTVPYQQGVNQCNGQIAAGNVCELTTYDTTHLLSPWYPEIRQLSAEFLYRQEVTCGLTFPDSPTTQPSCADIDWMATNGISTGFADGTYRPDVTLTRQAIVAFLWALAGSPDCTPSPPFSDVKGNHPFLLQIGWAAQNGVVGGFKDGTFRSAIPVTRQALASFLWKLAGAPSGAPDPDLGDVLPSHPFHEAISWVVDEGIMPGDAEHSFDSFDPVTREDAASFLHRANDAIGTFPAGCAD